MGLILGMDPWVFLAWILTILSAIFCLLYGVYYEYFKKPKKKASSSIKKEKIKEKEEK
jgi:hypothetical protein